VRKTKIKKVSKQPISKIQRQIWDECKRIIRVRYKNICYTCGKQGLEGSNWHTGHMLPKATLSAYLKYDLRLLRPQCYFCNVNCGGRGAEFIEKMRIVEGNEYVDNILKDKLQTVKAYDFYVELLAKYKQIEK
jgi:hypothetical protein